jgi:hypothetical protein
MNNTNIDNINIKATKIENSLHLLSLAFNVVINCEIVSPSSNYLDNFDDEEFMVMEF